MLYKFVYYTQAQNSLQTPEKPICTNDYKKRPSISHFSRKILADNHEIFFDQKLANISRYVLFGPAKPFRH